MDVINEVMVKGKEVKGHINNVHLLSHSFMVPSISRLSFSHYVRRDRTNLNKWKTGPVPSPGLLLTSFAFTVLLSLQSGP